MATEADDAATAVDTAPAKASPKKAVRRQPTGRKVAVKKPSSKKSARKRGPGKRYTKAEKSRILAAAAKGNMTGQQAAKKFGISTLTFYRWRGPVRGKKAKRGPGRPVGSGKVKVDQNAIRRAVQAQIRRLLPQIIREEVAAALKGR